MSVILSYLEKNKKESHLKFDKFPIYLYIIDNDFISISNDQSTKIYASIDRNQKNQLVLNHLDTNVKIKLNDVQIDSQEILKTSDCIEIFEHKIIIKEDLIITDHSTDSSDHSSSNPVNKSNLTISQFSKRSYPYKTYISSYNDDKNKNNTSSKNDEHAQENQNPSSFDSFNNLDNKLQNNLNSNSSQEISNPSISSIDISKSTSLEESKAPEEQNYFTLNEQSDIESLHRKSQINDDIEKQKHDSDLTNLNLTITHNTDPEEKGSTENQASDKNKSHFTQQPNSTNNETIESDDIIKQNSTIELPFKSHHSKTYPSLYKDSLEDDSDHSQKSFEYKNKTSDDSPEYSSNKDSEESSHLNLTNVKKEDQKNI